LASGELAGYVGLALHYLYCNNGLYCLRGWIVCSFSWLQLALQADFRHYSIYFAWTVWPLAMEAITGFRSTGTTHLRLQRRSSDDLRIQDRRFDTHRNRKLLWMAAFINFPTAICLSRIARSFYRLRRLCHLWANFITTCLTATNVLILVAVWMLIYTGEMEVYLMCTVVTYRDVHSCHLQRCAQLSLTEMCTVVTYR